LLSFNTLENNQLDDFTAELEKKEHNHIMLKALLKKRPQYKNLIVNIMKEVYSGREGRHALAGGIRRTIEKTKGSRFGVYKQIAEIQKCLVDIKLTMSQVAS
jgi:hypothetical protein